MGLQVIGVRHGEVHNPEGVIYSGLPGFGLSDLGRRQAASVGEALRDIPLDALYASPLDRALETAQVIGELVGAEVIPDERLHEWRHWQQFAGLTWEQLRTEAREAWEAYTSDPGSVTSGESLDALADRVEAWLGDVQAAHQTGLVLAVSHLEPLRAILLRKLRRPASELFDLKIGLGEAVRILPEADAQALDGAALRASLV